MIVPNNMKITINDACGLIEQQGLENVIKIYKGNEKVIPLIKKLIK